jgi:hypothetical protein
MAVRVFKTFVPRSTDGWTPDAVGLFRAASASKARYLCYLSARDAGWPVLLTDILVRRAAEYDSASFSQGSMPSYARFPTPEAPHAAP